MSVDRWMEKKMWFKHIYMIYVLRMEYCSAIKKNEIMPFAATWMDLERIILSKVSQREKDKYCVMWNLKYETDKFLYETETDSDIEKRLVAAKGGWSWWGKDWEFGISRYKLLGWPQNLFGFFHQMVQKNPDEHFSHPNIIYRMDKQKGPTV